MLLYGAVIFGVFALVPMIASRCRDQRYQALRSNPMEESTANAVDPTADDGDEEAQQVETRKVSQPKAKKKRDPKAGGRRVGARGGGRREANWLQVASRAR